MADDHPSNPRRVEIQEQRRILDDFFKVDEAVLQYERYSGEMSEPVRRLKFDRGHSAAAVVVKLPAREILLVEQFKYPAYRPGSGWVVETVAGMVESTDTAEQTIRREIREEIGYEVSLLEPINSFLVSPGGSSERVSLFYAEVSDETRVDGGGGVAAEGEDIAVYVLPAAKLDDALADGTIDDAKTLIGLMWLRSRWKD